MLRNIHTCISTRIKSKFSSLLRKIFIKSDRTYLLVWHLLTSLTRYSLANFATSFKPNTKAINRIGNNYVNLQFRGAKGGG